MKWVWEGGGGDIYIYLLKTPYKILSYNKENFNILATCSLGISAGRIEPIFNTPCRRQSKMLSTIDECGSKLIETMFLIAICRYLFLWIFDLRSLIVLALSIAAYPVCSMVANPKDRFSHVEAHMYGNAHFTVHIPGLQISVYQAA